MDGICLVKAAKKAWDGGVRGAGYYVTLLVDVMRSLRMRLDGLDRAFMIRTMDIGTNNEEVKSNVAFTLPHFPFLNVHLPTESPLANSRIPKCHHSDILRTKIQHYATEFCLIWCNISTQGQLLATPNKSSHLPPNYTFIMPPSTWHHLVPYKSRGPAFPVHSGYYTYTQLCLHTTLS